MTRYLLVFLIFASILFNGCNSKSSKDKVSRTPISSINKKTVKPTVNIYLENSGSMDGYVNGGTDFANILYRYVTNLKTSDLSSSINLNYINDKIIPLGNNLDLFDNQNLNPYSFKNKGGNRGSTDIPEVFSQVLKHTNNDTVSIIISDFIISPGYGTNAEKYLEDQKTKIMSIISSKLNKDNLAILFYQFYSNFNGIYYNAVDAKTKIDSPRPFYICIMGDKEDIMQLSTSMLLEDDLVKSKFKNEFSITKNTEVKYSIVPSSGNFKIDKKDTKKIVKAKKDKRNDNKLKFVVNVDFSKLILDKDYLENTSNFFLSDKDFKLESVKQIKDKNFTHSLIVSTSIIKPSTLTIELKNNFPLWVEKYNDSDGFNINANGAMNKTFGLKYFIEGIHQAYTKNNQDFFTKIIISINK